MVVRSVADIVECYEAGRFVFLPMWRKTPFNSNSANGWYFDGASFSAGTPAPSFYAGTPRLFLPIGRSNSGGWDHGPDVAPATKYLKRLSSSIQGYSAAFKLIDIIGAYPFFDQALVDEEQVTDRFDPLPSRLRGGDGVGMYVVAQFANTGSAQLSLTVRYINQDGAEKVTPSRRLLTDAAVSWGAGSIVSRGSDVAFGSTSGPWLALAEGDRGVREVLGVTLTGTPDTGLFAVVLARPVAELPTQQGIIRLDTNMFGRYFVERDFGREISKLPVIDDDAYLSFLTAQYGNTSDNFYLHLAEGEVIWK